MLYVVMKLFPSGKRVCVEIRKSYIEAEVASFEKTQDFLQGRTGGRCGVYSIMGWNALAGLWHLDVTGQPVLQVDADY